MHRLKCKHQTAKCMKRHLTGLFSLSLLHFLLLLLFSSGSLYADMCGPVGLCKYHYAASGGKHRSLHGAIPQRDDQPHGCRCGSRCPNGLRRVMVGNCGILNTMTIICQTSSFTTNLMSINCAHKGTHRGTDLYEQLQCAVFLRQCICHRPLDGGSGSP